METAELAGAFFAGAVAAVFEYLRHRRTRSKLLTMIEGFENGARALEDPRSVTMHGELVHNRYVQRELRARGFASVPEGERDVPPATPRVLVTAHGLSDAERARLLLAGFGAWFEGERLSGIAALETRRYTRNRLGEIVGLYTITKFQGEGVGMRIVDELLEVARAAKLRAIFACTRNERAAEFFKRAGFEAVSASKVPAGKWRRRSPGSERPRVFWRDL